MVITQHKGGHPPVSVRAVRTMRGLVLSLLLLRPKALLEMVSKSTFQMGSTAPANQHTLRHDRPHLEHDALARTQREKLECFLTHLMAPGEPHTLSNNLTHAGKVTIRSAVSETYCLAGSPNQLLRMVHWLGVKEPVIMLLAPTDQPLWRAKLYVSTKERTVQHSALSQAMEEVAQYQQRLFKSPALRLNE